jgi:YidC/Oxa1 family membrane protein insertase
VWLFYAPVYNLMIFLLSLFNWVFWWAIITITIIIRLALLWPQQKMMMSQRKLQAIQPKIKEIQEKYKWQQQVLGVKLMELYKTEKVNPMWSCGFLIIQMPILLVIYHIILSIKDPSNFFYTYSFLSDFNLSSIDYNFFGLNLLWSWWVAWVILAISVATIQFFQIKLSLAGKAQDKKWIVLEKKKWNEWYSQFMPDPEVMNKFMLYWMPAMVWVFTYTLFAWIGIYWGISTLFMLVQQFIVNKKMQK